MRKKKTKDITLLKINRQDIVELQIISYEALCKQISRGHIFSSRDLWTNFWALVEFLEDRGMRPH